MKQIFISYSHKDEEWKNRLLKHLRVYENEGHFILWDDRKIESGNDWRVEIITALDQACVAIMLITADFLTSNFILNEEVPRALSRKINEGLRIIPIIIKPCPWESVGWLTSLQVTPRDGEPIMKGDEYAIEKKLADIACEIYELTPKRGTLDSLFLAKLPTTSSDFFGRKAELEVLDNAWIDRRIHIVSLIAWAGTGKTALINHWLNRITQQDFHGAVRVYAWSFYNQGVQGGHQIFADEFMAHALNWFGDPKPLEGSNWDKGIRLSQLIRSNRTLLILDGLELLQHSSGELLGRLRDHGLQALLRELARSNPGLCILSSRVPVYDIREMIGSSVKHLELAQLSPSDGVQLLEKLGVKGSQKEIKHTVQEYQGHPLTLTLLGRYLAVVYQGDIRKRKLIRALTQEPSKGEHARRVMESYADWLEDKHELTILYLMGLFNRPATSSAINALREKPAIKGLTSHLLDLTDSEWCFKLQNLRDLRLLSQIYEREPDVLDCHPLIREYFSKRLQSKYPEAWTEAHSRLFDHYKLQSKNLPDNLGEMDPLFAAIFHGCQAGRHSEALRNVYYERISRKEEQFITKNLGAYGADVTTLSNFFDIPWSRPAQGFSEGDRSSLWNWIGNSLRAQGRLVEAAAAMKSGMESSESLKDWKGAAVDCGNLSEVHLMMGKVDQAIAYARQSVDFADRSNHVETALKMRVTLGDALHQAGKLSEAEEVFHRAEIMQEDSQPSYPILYAFCGYLYCDLLLTYRRYHEVLERASQTLQWGIQGGLGYLSVALDKLSLGQAYLMQTINEECSQYSKATEYIDQAVQELHRATVQHHLPRGLLCYAVFYRLQGDYNNTRKYLDEIRALSQRCGMKLYLADCCIETTRLAMCEGDSREAQINLAEAKTLVMEAGYYRRKSEILELEQMIQSALKN